jgi:hypothetical protein
MLNKLVSRSSSSHFFFPLRTSSNFIGHCGH